MINKSLKLALVAVFAIGVGCELNGMRFIRSFWGRSAQKQEQAFNALKKGWLPQNKNVFIKRNKDSDKYIVVPSNQISQYNLGGRLMHSSKQPYFVGARVVEDRSGAKLSWANLGKYSLFLGGAWGTYKFGNKLAR